jgi:hypothetical protein
VFVLGVAIPQPMSGYRLEEWGSIPGRSKGILSWSQTGSGADGTPLPKGNMGPSPWWKPFLIVTLNNQQWVGVIPPLARSAFMACNWAALLY